MIADSKCLRCLCVHSRTYLTYRLRDVSTQPCIILNIELIPVESDARVGANQNFSSKKYKKKARKIRREKIRNVDGREA